MEDTIMFYSEDEGKTQHPPDPIKAAFYGAKGSPSFDRVQLECVLQEEFLTIDKTRALEIMREFGKRFRDHFYGRITKIEVLEKDNPASNFVICLEEGQLEIRLPACANTADRFEEGDTVLVEFDLPVVGDTVGHHVNCMRNGQVYREFWIDNGNLAG